VKVGGEGETEADQSQKCCNWMDDEDRGEGVSGAGRERKVIVVVCAERLIWVVADLYAGALCALASSKDSKVYAAVCGQGYGLDDGCGKGAEQEEDKGDEVEEGEWGGRS